MATITFGDTQNTHPRQFGDLGGKLIGCNGGSVIDQIWVDGGSGNITTYGGEGGAPAGSVILPSNGIIHLKEMYTGDHNGAVSYLIFGVLDNEGKEKEITFGSSGAWKTTQCILTEVNLWVKFYEIYCGSYVDRLVFQVVD